MLHTKRSTTNTMIKYFHVEIQSKDKYWVPPLTLHMLGVTEPKKKIKIWMACLW